MHGAEVIPGRAILVVPVRCMPVTLGKAEGIVVPEGGSMRRPWHGAVMMRCLRCSLLLLLLLLRQWGSWRCCRAVVEAILGVLLQHAGHVIVHVAQLRQRHVAAQIGGIFVGQGDVAIT